MAGNSNNQRSGVKGPESLQTHRAILSFGKYAECHLCARLALEIYTCGKTEMGLWSQNSQIVQETVRQPGSGGAGSPEG